MRPLTPSLLDLMTAAPQTDCTNQMLGNASASYAAAEPVGLVGLQAAGAMRRATGRIHPNANIGTHKQGRSACAINGSGPSTIGIIYGMFGLRPGACS